MKTQPRVGSSERVTNLLRYLSEMRIFFAAVNQTKGSRVVPENYWESVLELETRLGMGNTRISSDNCFLFLLILYKGGSSNFKIKLLKITILSSPYFNISEKASSMKNRIV